MSGFTPQLLDMLYFINAFFKSQEKNSFFAGYFFIRTAGCPQHTMPPTQPLEMAEAPETAVFWHP